MKASKRVRPEQLAGELNALPGRISEAAATALRAPWFKEAARSLCPVDTGALQASIRIEDRGVHRISIVAGGAGFVNPRTLRPVDYARRVHEGTSSAPPRPFLLQAVLMERGRYLRAMLEEAAGRF